MEKNTVRRRKWEENLHEIINVDDCDVKGKE
jgi:hypothetical protein